MKLSNSAAHVSTSLYTGFTPSFLRSARTFAAPSPLIPNVAASRSSDKPIRLAASNSCALILSTPISATTFNSSAICFIWYRNHGSIPV